MPFLRKKSHSALTSLHVSFFSEQTIGIDTSVLLYKYASSLKDDWLSGFQSLCSFLQKNHITPIFVFNGEPYAEKGITLERRQERESIYKEEVRNCQKHISITNEQMK